MHNNFAAMDFDLQEKDKQFVWHPFTPLKDVPDPVLISKAEGIFLHTPDGRKIIDAISSWWVNIHGHSHPAIARAVAKQAETLEHVIFAGFTHEPAVSLAEKLLTQLTTGYEKVFYSDNGSTSVEVALKMGIQFWHNSGEQKSKVIAIDGAYHGDTFGAMSVGERSLFTQPFFPFLFETSFIDFPTEKNHEAVITQFDRLTNDPQVGIFIFEPLVQGASGMRVYSNHLLDTLLGIAGKKNIICIADEVFTGFGRTGKLLATNYLSNKPDIICLSKGLTGGTMPLGATLANEKIVSAFSTPELAKTFFHGHSFTANPLACASANASFELLMSDNCQQQILRLTQWQENFAKQIVTHNKINSVHQLGTILSLELKTSEKTSYDNSARKKIYEYFLERDILLRPLGNVIYVVPPYVTKQEELNHIHKTILEFLQTY